MIRFLFQQKIVLVFWKEHFKSFAECYLCNFYMYLVHLDTKYVVAEGMYCFGIVAAFLKKSWTLMKNRKNSVFLAKSIFTFTVGIVENAC